MRLANRHLSVRCSCNTSILTPLIPDLVLIPTIPIVRPTGGHVVCRMHRGRAFDEIRLISGIVGVRPAEPDLRYCGDAYITELAWVQRSPGV